MAREGSVRYLNTAKSGKNDEFYTILSDIEDEAASRPLGERGREGTMLIRFTHSTILIGNSP
jgi:hypothetical protein